MESIKIDKQTYLSTRLNFVSSARKPKIGHVKNDQSINHWTSLFFCRISFTKEKLHHVRATAGLGSTCTHSFQERFALISNDTVDHCEDNQDGKKLLVLQL